MCGIAGYIGELNIDPKNEKRCLDLMGRRGPDARGIYRHKSVAGINVCLLHSRLSIIDIDKRANQPFISGPLALIYNGELYNYLELRNELKHKGIEFSTESDTEVLLKMIECYGLSGLDRCEGMWAFALYNENDNSFVLCRDRFGEKPLFYYKDKSGLYFGSEVKFIRALLGESFEINYEQLYRYMVNGYRALFKNRQTFYKGLLPLSPASVLHIDALGREKKYSYWTPRFHIDESLSYEDVVEGTRELLIKSVQLRLRADVPLAFCLSGGVDSNALISIAQKVMGFDVHGFTIVDDDPRYEEGGMTEYSAQTLGIRHTVVRTKVDNFLSDLKTLVCYHDAPVATITYFAHWKLLESIADKGYKISISGIAADELFSGYYDHYLAYLYQMYLENGVYYHQALADWRIYVLPLVRNPVLGNSNLFIEDPYQRDYIYPDSDLFSDFLLNRWKEPFVEETYTGNLLKNRMANELFHESVPVVLNEDDLNSMYYSVENRSPFLDRNLFEFCTRIPTRHLVKDGMAKAVLRDSMRGIVPEKVINNRRKIGFNAPLFSYLDITDTSVWEYLLDQSIIFEHVDRGRVESLLSRTDFTGNESRFLFNFLNSKLFLEECGS